MADQFIDKEREDTLKKIASKEWATCEKCDWFFKTSVLERCPMCHHEWKKPVFYQQPAYESNQLNV